MSPIDPSKLKEALDDFIEKETLIREEIKLVEQQIEELHNRTTTCNERLSLVGKDRQKVLDIANRYTSTPIISQAAPIAAPAEKPAIAKTEAPAAPSKPVLKAVPDSPATAKVEAKVEAKTESKDKPTVSEKPAVAPIKTPPATPAKTPPAAKVSDAKEAAKEPAKESDKATPEPEDDTVKNINEALRGLFR